MLITAYNNIMPVTAETVEQDYEQDKEKIDAQDQEYNKGKSDAF